ncbi:MAG: hypothetical protein RML94_00090 [Bacteroidia bacterium]|nr:hypothetical protein [Bacteroidia bacterium]
MKTTTEGIAGGVLVLIVIFINAIFDYFNRSTVQAIINAICAFVTTLLLKLIYERIKEKIKRNKAKNL